MKKIRIVYYSSSGNTLSMAEALALGSKENCNDTKVYNIVSDVDIDDIFSADVIAIGSSACGEETIEENFLLPFIMDNKEKFKDKEIFLFGSWGWGQGQYMDQTKVDLESFGAKVCDNIVLANEAPDDETLEMLKNIGKNF